MFRNRPSPNSWGEALARSEHAPPETEPHSERSPIWERAEIKGGLSALVMSEALRLGLFGSACGIVVGLAIALAVN